jgi:RHS repeat-associated protein
MMGSTQGTVSSGAGAGAGASSNAAPSTTTLRETFSYDPAGNVVDGMFGSRSSSNSGKGTGYVAHNKVIVFEDKRYQYDAFGRLSEKRSSKHGLQTFAYDAEHRLIQVTKHESTGYKQTATQTTTFTYDALGRRTSKTHNMGDAYSPETKTIFSWDGLRLLSETTQTVRGDKTSLYIYADSESYEPLARVDTRVDTLDAKTGTLISIAAQATNTPANDDSIDENDPKPTSKIFHFHNDLNGLPQELSSEGEFVWKATYKVWGNVATEEWTGEYQHAKQLGETQNLRFQGQYYDQETGLHYNTFRFFDPDVGRFTQGDPIGLAGGNNLYQYAPNPIGWLDPWGLCINANKATGKAHGDAVTANAQSKNGAANVRNEVYIRPILDNGKLANYRIRADNTVHANNSMKPSQILEAKGSATAPFTKNQKKGFPLIQRNGGIIETGTGKQKTFMKIDPTKVTVVRPGEFGKIK